MRRECDTTSALREYAAGVTILTDMESLLHFAVNTVTVLFFIGMAGSAVVVLISFVEDIFELLED